LGREIFHVVGAREEAVWGEGGERSSKAAGEEAVWGEGGDKSLRAAGEEITAAARGAIYTIVVDFGEWNVKNGYTAPAVKPNRCLLPLN
jgi:hypothetical protein